MNTQPYRYLNFTKDPLVAGWNTINDLESLFIHVDSECKLLKPEIKDIFLSQNLIPKANLLSYAPNSLRRFYHTDMNKDEKTECAINWLLAGNPGKTEWSYQALEMKVDIPGKTGVHGTEPELWGRPSLTPDFSTSLIQPMLIRTNVPHRVNTLGIDTWRISYSVRFYGNPPWQEVVEKLSNHIL